MKEQRYTELSEIETRDDELEISGYAIVFGEPSKVLGGSEGFREVISHRALEGVSLNDTHLYYQHNSDQMLANTKSGTMNLSITGRGLHFSARMADTQLGKDTYKLIKRGDLSAMSFGFRVAKDSWNVMTSPETRTVEKILDLSEISIVSRPAYEQSSVNARSAEFLLECRDCRLETQVKNDSANDMLTLAKELLKEVQTKEK